MHGSKAASVEEALTHIRSGQTIMLSGFTNVGSPNKFIVKMAEAGPEPQGGGADERRYAGGGAGPPGNAG